MRRALQFGDSDGGEIFTKMEEMFFAHRFGQCRDKFGANWMIMNENRCSETVERCSNGD